MNLRLHIFVQFSTNFEILFVNNATKLNVNNNDGNSLSFMKISDQKEDERRRVSTFETEMSWESTTMLSRFSAVVASILVHQLHVLCAATSLGKQISLNCFLPALNSFIQFALSLSRF